MTIDELLNSCLEYMKKHEQRPKFVHVTFDELSSLMNDPQAPRYFGYRFSLDHPMHARDFAGMTYILCDTVQERFTMTN